MPLFTRDCYIIVRSRRRKNDKPRSGGGFVHKYINTCIRNSLVKGTGRREHSGNSRGGFRGQKCEGTIKRKIVEYARHAKPFYMEIADFKATERNICMRLKKQEIITEVEKNSINRKFNLRHGCTRILKVYAKKTISKHLPVSQAHSHRALLSQIWAHLGRTIRLLRFALARSYILHSIGIHSSLFLVILYCSSSQICNIVNVDHIFSKLLNLFFILTENGNSIHLSLNRP